MSAPTPRPLLLITGASAGLGEGFARLYAAHGWDLALTARRAGRLETLAAELRARHGAQVLTIPLDLAEPGAADRLIDAVEAEGRHVDGLINNAGYSLTGGFLSLSPEQHAGMLAVMARPSPAGMEASGAVQSSVCRTKPRSRSTGPPTSTG